MQKGVLGIIGHPVSHSLSPLMHNAAATALGLDYVYTAFDVPPELLREAVSGLRALGIVGLNVTVPHKVAVMEYLDAIDDDATAIGAVNTVTARGGKLLGSNTDGIGFMRSLKKTGFKPKGKTAVMIGAGGSSRAIGVALLKAGLGELVVVNRTPEKGEEFTERLSQWGEVVFAGNSPDIASEAIGSCDLVVQTTPLGMRKNDPLPFGSGPAALPFRKGQYVYDIIYSPAQTPFLKIAGRKGAKTVNGLSMLLFQGSESFRIWTGKKFPEDKVMGKLKRHLATGG